MGSDLSSVLPKSDTMPCQSWHWLDDEPDSVFYQMDASQAWLTKTTFPEIWHIGNAHGITTATQSGSAAATPSGRFINYQVFKLGSNSLIFWWKTDMFSSFLRWLLKLPSGHEKNLGSHDIGVTMCDKGALIEEGVSIQSNSVLWIWLNFGSTSPKIILKDAVPIFMR